MEYHIKKDLNYYTKKINNYITLINSGEELSDKEKEIIEKKLIKLVSKLELIKKSEELNIENINNKQKKILKENLFNQYKAYLTNKNIYLSNKIEDKKKKKKEGVSRLDAIKISIIYASVMIMLIRNTY